MTDAANSDPAVIARAITMRGPWGPVYGPVDLDIAAGGATVLVCPPGSGRTALLMTLAGRMRPGSGTLSVFGRSKVRDIFTGAGLAAIEDLDGVSESVTVADALTEQLRWYKLVGRADEAALARVCGPVFGELPLPPLHEYVEELTELDRMLLRIALANTANPRLLVVGDIEQVSHDESRDQLVSRLVELGQAQTVVTASANGVTGHPVDQILVENTSRVSHAGQQKGGA